MRVFHLSANVYPTLPAAHHTRRIWGELSKGCEQYHVIASAGRLAYSHTVEGNLHLHLLPAIGRRGWQFFLTSWFAILLAFAHRPDRVIAQCPVNGGIAAVFLGKLMRLPVLVEVHGAHYFQSIGVGFRHRIGHAFYRLFSRISFRRATRVRSLSSDMSERLAATYGEHIRSKIVVVGNRVDLGVFSPVKRSYAVGDSINIVSVGAFSALKGHMLLIEHLLTRYTKVRLLLVGRGPLHASYLERAQSLGVSDRLELRFAGTHSEVADALAASDIYVHPSFTEGVPRAILEAMAMGLPVVATNVGFLGGVVENGHDILLVPVGEAGAFVDAVGRLIESESLRQRLGGAAAETIQSRCEWAEVFSRYRALIASLPDCD